MTLSFPYLDNRIFLNFTFLSIPLIYNPAINRVAERPREKPAETWYKELQMSPFCSYILTSYTARNMSFLSFRRHILFWLNKRDKIWIPGLRGHKEVSVEMKSSVVFFSVPIQSTRSNPQYQRKCQKKLQRRCSLGESGRKICVLVYCFLFSTVCVLMQKSACHVTHVEVRGQFCGS